MSKPTDRLPPYSPDNEQTVLSCCLQDNTCIDACQAVLGSEGEPFYDLRHRVIYSAMVAMRDENLPVHAISVQQFLLDTKMLSECGGVEYLLTLPDLAPSAANLSYALDIVFEKYLMRRAIEICTQAVARIYDFEGEIADLLDELERDIMAIQPAKSPTGHGIKDLVRASINELERLFETRGALEGIPTGFPDLDKLSGGFKAGEMTVIAGYPGAGKTSFAMNLAEHAMLEQKKKVAVFSLEMSAEQLVTRFLCSHARVNLRNIKDGFLNEADFPKLTGAAHRIGNASIHFEDQSDLSIHQLRAVARRLHQQHGIELMVVDYLQLLSASGGSRRIENRQQEVADISRGIKAIARELKLPVIGLSQLNDNGELRESRAIGQDADNVWILKPEPESQVVQLKITKARNGPVGVVNLLFFREHTRFESCAKNPHDDSDYPNPHND